jgi:pyruvate/2-oxoacid:ferredoxin oxidoreductase alpha subunit
MNHTRTIIAASGLSTKEIARRTGILRSIIDGAYKGGGREFTPQEVGKIERALGAGRV